MKLCVILTFLLYCNYAKCAKILGVIPFPSRSHNILGSSLMLALAEAGHDVTVITPFRQKNLPKNVKYREIFLSGFVEAQEKQRKGMNFFEKRSPFTMVFHMQEMLTEQNEGTFNHPEVKKLINSKEKFDVVLIEQFFNDALKIFAHLFEAHLVLFTSTAPIGSVNQMVGNPEPISYIPHIMGENTPQMTFFQRVQNTLSWLFWYSIENFLMFPNFVATLNKNFPNAPPHQEIFTNVSLVLINSHESMGYAVPHVPNMIQIGGFHIKPPQKLPADLQEFLDNAKDGVIYFSMGSNLKSAELPPEKRDIFLNAFRKLKEKVLWKWEEDVLPGQPPNVKLGKWLPQQDILAHPNVKLFITHGGLLSTTETIYHGKPVLTVPVFADQLLNSKFATMNGFGRSLPILDESFSEEKFSSLIHELLTNSSYTENIKKRSQIFHDRPMKPMETAIYWIEHVIRTNGAHHLRVAGIGLPWYKYFLLDVILFLIVTTTLAISLLYIGIKKVFKILFNKKAKKEKTN